MTTTQRTRRTRRALRPVVVIGACLVAFLAPALTSFALWSTSTTHVVSVSTLLSTPPPTAFSCTSGPGAATVTLSWSAPSGASPTGYQVMQATAVRKPVAAPATTTTFTLAEAASGGPIALRAVYPGSVFSAATPTVPIQRNTNQGTLKC